ncbi:MAG: SET domain-containing protein [Gemmatimonadaceae bacterium]|nr:SET domain-containing protein [Gemmatimonadaceae bacterium]
MTNPADFLRALRGQSYVMLRPSPIAGVGVFAIRDIPKGCRDMFSPPGADDEFVAVPRALIDAEPPHVRALVENYCLYDETTYWVPRDGFRRLDCSLFLNHSDTPNVVSVDDGAYFEALRDIAMGEELLVDYGELVDDTDTP